LLEIGEAGLCQSKKAGAEESPAGFDDGDKDLPF